METIQTFGLSVFLWKVLPVLTILQASVIFSVVGILPSVLHIFSSQKAESKIKNLAFIALDVLACLLQIGGLIALTVFIYSEHGKCEGAISK